MSIFGNIVSAIFGKGATPGSAAVTTAETIAPAQKGSTTASGGVASGKPMTRDEVDAMIKKIADGHKEKYNWNQSIVDLMKLLNLDSSLSARKQLAQELGYKGELNGSAEMNTWLHKQVMTKLAESGGVVPESLKHA
jgi:hypothetical protein